MFLNRNTNVTVLCLLGDMVVQGTFLTPTGVFLVSMVIMYMVTAILHPEEFGTFIFPLFVFCCELDFENVA